jgi:GMP synthase (glutamine-hydrolysing)
MGKKPYREMVAILDFGSQYSQLIARRVRESQVYCKLLPFDITSSQLLKYNVKGIILSGGPASLTGKGAPYPEPDIFDLGIPVLGICYGMQLLAHFIRGRITPAPEREYGKSELFIDNKEDLFYELSSPLDVWMSHTDQVTLLPSGFEIIAHTHNCPIASMRDKKRKLYGVQFHPEVVHTPQGKRIIENYLSRICGCSKGWTMSSFIDYSVDEIRKKVKGGKVVCALSGGVDSSVTATLVHRATGDRLGCIFVNNGLLRQGETEEVRKTFFDHFRLNLRCVQAEERFLKKLAGVIDPEKKRKLIGEEFINVFTEEARKFGRVDFLAQGTLYPDVIESVSVRGEPSATIKSHHNLFKDEVRVLGRELGLPEAILKRQPFPGPGLAVRIIGEITKERLAILRQADLRIAEEMRNYDRFSEIWQSFAVLLPIKSVGVMGDQRTYEHTIALRIVTSIDGMTADWARIPYEILGRISNRIINEVKGANRVVYDISSKPPSTIEWE